MHLGGPSQWGLVRKDPKPAPGNDHSEQLIGKSRSPLPQEAAQGQGVMGQWDT